MYHSCQFHHFVFGTLKWNGSQLKLLATAAQLMGTVTTLCDSFHCLSNLLRYPNPPIFSSRLLGRLCGLPT